MIPLKWRIFRIANLAQFIVILACFALLLYRFSQGVLRGGAFFFVFSSGSVVMALTNCFNLYVFNKYFPDRSIPAVLKKINTLLLIVGFAISVSLVLIVVAGSMVEFDNRDRDPGGKILLLIYVVILINWVYILCMQIKMFNAIGKENHTSLAKAVNSIGQE